MNARHKKIRALLPVVLFAMACNNQTSCVQPTPTASASETASAPLSSVAPAVAPAVVEMPSYPADLNLGAITKQLGCSSGKTKLACEVCNEFGKAERFTGKTPSGEGRWFGRAYIVESGKERTEYRLLLARALPTARVGKFSLPLGITIAPITPELGSEAGRLWTKMSGPRHRGNRKNLVFKYLEALEPKAERGAINSSGMSVQLIAEPTEDIGYLRQPALKKLLLVMPARGVNAAPGDGTYAEFWQAVW